MKQTTLTKMTQMMTWISELDNPYLTSTAVLMTWISELDNPYLDNPYNLDIRGDIYIFTNSVDVATLHILKRNKHWRHSTIYWKKTDAGKYTMFANISCDSCTKQIYDKYNIWTIFLLWYNVIYISSVYIFQVYPVTTASQMPSPNCTQ